MFVTITLLKHVMFCLGRYKSQNGIEQNILDSTALFNR